MEELRLDYEDFLRQRGLEMWEREDQRRSELITRRPAGADDVAQWVKEIRGRSGQNGRKEKDEHRGKSAGSMPSMESTYSEIAANGALALIAVAVSLLDRQIAAQAGAFEKEGGFTERLYRRRTSRRQGE